MKVNEAKKNKFFMTRKGKIARLPQQIREQINFRLQDGEEAKQIADWLNTLPKVQALLKAEFDGQPINENNLSNWKLGGFRDWEEQQESLQAVRRFGADAAALRQAAPGGRLPQPTPGAQITDQVALCLAARLAVALGKVTSLAEDPADQVQCLCHLSSRLVALRKGDHNAQWLQIERDKLALQTKKFRADEAARKLAAEGPNLTYEGGIPPEVMEQIERELRLF